MTGKNVIALAAAATTLAMTASAFADASRETKIQQLEAKVAELENKQSQNSKDVAATIDSVLRDAEKRSQLLATNGDASSGYDNGFFIRSGDFLLRPSLTFQFRNVTDYREETSGPKDDEIENGFEVRRLQFNLSGTAFTKDLTYAFQWNTDRNAGHMFLEDAWVRYMFADDWGMRVGQFKGPVSHEKILGDSRIIAVERSLQDAALLGGFFDRVQGATLIYGGYNKNNPLNVEVGLIDGANSKNTDYVGHYPSDPSVGVTGAPSGHAWDFGVEGRAEYKFSGDWKNYSDFSTQTTKENLAVLGGGFEWDQGGDGDVLIGTIDFHWEGTNGFGVYGAAAVRHMDGFGTGTLDDDDDDRTDWSLLAQVTYLINPSVEVFGRYTYLEYDDDVLALGEDTFHEITVGLAYYLGNNGSAGHRAKVTIDLNWLPDGAPFQIKSAGYLGDSNGEDEIVIRGQFQLMI
jgi:hypothetical protein